MGIENVRPSNQFSDPNRFGGVAELDEPRPTDAQQAEDERKRKLHGRLMDWLHMEREKQAINRYQMAIDEDFYDGLQYSDEDAAELLDRGQAPLVFNLVKPTINWLLGTERRTRIDGKVLPREAADEENAEHKTKVLKYFSDVNRVPYSRSDAWASTVIAGLGWLEDGVNPDPDEEIIYSRYESWRYVYHDSTSIERDGRDMRYLFRFKWLDLDVALSLFPDDQHDKIRAAAIDSDALQVDEDDTYYLGMRVNGEMAGNNGLPQRRSFVSESGMLGNRRQRVKIYEGWYRDPKRVTIMRGAGRFHGQLFDRNDPQHSAALAAGEVSIVTHSRMQVRVALFTDGDLLLDMDSPYRHNRFPLTPMWCYRRRRDGMPYGVVRDIRDAQEDYNKRASKALFILSTNQVIMDTDAVDDVEEVRAEAARPDGVLRVKKGAKRFEIRQDKQLAEEHLHLMDRDAKMIFDTGGVTESNLGRDSQAKSGIAIGKLQDQGSIVTAPLFDNMRFAIQTQSTIQLSLIEQYVSAPKAIRLIGENTPVSWLKINQYDPTTGRFLNDITAYQADYIVSEADFKASTRQAMFETMMELVGKLDAQVGLALLDMVIDFADVPNKTELLARIRKLNGQRDPSVKPTPEELQAQAEADAKQKAMEDLQLKTVAAQLDKILAEIQKNAAETAKINSQKIREEVTAFYESLQAGQIVATVPGVAPTADAIMAAAGYVDTGAGQDPNIPGPSGALPAMTPQPKNGVFVGQEAGTGAPPDAGAAPAAPANPAGPATPVPQQAAGAQSGIQTPTNDGVKQ